MIKRRKPRRNPITPQQRKFVEAYARLGIGGRAAIEAGYAPANADVQASKMLTKDKIKLAVQELAAKSMESTIADNTQRRQFWSDMMNGKKKKVPWIVRLRASELLGKTAGDFLERIEHSGKLVTLNLNLAGPKK